MQCAGMLDVRQRYHTKSRENVTNCTFQESKTSYTHSTEFLQFHHFILWEINMEAAPSERGHIPCYY